MSDTPPEIYCSNHPTVLTTLRCSRCEKPICPKCAISTPTGYRCKECVRGQQKIFETALWRDYAIAGLIAVVLSYLGSILVGYVGFFAIFLAPIAGGIIAEIVRAATGRRRSKRLFQLAALSAVLGSLPALLLPLPGLILAGGMGGILSVVWNAVYTFTVGSTVYYRLSGIQMR